MLYDIVQPMAEAYANFFLWAFAGAPSAELWLVLTAVILGTAIMCIPLYLALNGRAGKLVSFLALPFFVFGLFFALALGINGTAEFQSNFRECVQIEDRTTVVPQTVMIRMCRTRDNLADDLGPWQYSNMIAGQKFIGVPEVQELP